MVGSHSPPLIGLMRVSPVVNEHVVHLDVRGFTGRALLECNKGVAERFLRYLVPDDVTGENLSKARKDHLEVFVPGDSESGEGKNKKAEERGGEKGTRGRTNLCSLHTNRMFSGGAMSADGRSPTCRHIRKEGQNVPGRKHKTGEALAPTISRTTALLCASLSAMASVSASASSAAIPPAVVEADVY